MRKLAFLVLPFLAFVTPAASAEIEVYDSGEVVVESAPAAVAVERRYYYTGPVEADGVVVVRRGYRMPHVYQDGYVGRADRPTGFGGPRNSRTIDYSDGYLD